MTTIEFEDVHHHFGERVVLRGIDLSLTEHRVGIIGGNGSGKSTLARMINGLHLPERGRVLVDGEDTRKRAAAIRRRVGFVFTDPDHQIVMPTVAEDIGFSLRRAKMSKAERAARVAEVLAQFDLAGHADHPCHLLSGGQKQLLALAAVLVTEPDILVADEPTTLLDLRNARRFAEILRRLPQQVVVVTHSLELVADFDRVLVIDDGKVAADDAPAPAIEFYRKLIG
ncbi:energy-coupling factor ABC transporter ATP-binding protein [Tomitella biformata]|uniref:energy-coupling factor ABC transporter ATP-binding protein n=1 Tax=Tomitella biformata TaxID=630403 RepID=UPI0004634678|nr:ABC transporter ATP-binding protein [Tomitella biformata]